ncbi:hypothetical protein [Helicobacter burdigaliensis]|uniref:hypothetical protein n=1 Tax=Helicobacter burdigaliensis TaxID=2315334 RepID=UPI000EF65475|nr:hypothetical protein [Helicobacter burdigaliensis]
MELKDFLNRGILELENFLNHTEKEGDGIKYEVILMQEDLQKKLWKYKQKEFMCVLLRLLIWKRDNEKVSFNFSDVLAFMSMNTLVKTAIKYKFQVKKDKAIEEYVRYITKALQIDYEEFVRGDVRDIQWLSEVLKKSETRTQSVNEILMCIKAWRITLSNLPSLAEHRREQRLAKSV